MLNRKIIVETSNNVANNYIVSLLDKISAERVIVKEDKYTVFSISFNREFLPILERGIARVCLTTSKLEYLKNKLNVGLNNHNIIAVITALIYFDFEAEEDYILNCICENKKYSITGIINFNVKDLHLNWLELVGLASNLLENGDDEDILNVANFLLTSRTQENKSIFVVDYDLMIVSNIVKGFIIDYVKMFDNSMDNLINIIAQESPIELIVEREFLTLKDIQILSKLVKVTQL